MSKYYAYYFAKFDLQEKSVGVTVAAPLLKEVKMHPGKELELLEKLKKSEYWRDDFKISSREDVKGVLVYRVEAKDSEPSTILAIAKLNEVLRVS